MGFRGIARYSLTALVAGAVAAAACLIARRHTGRGRGARGVLLACYLAALIQITALRLGLVTPRWLGGSLHLTPLETTLSEARRGAWPLIYHVVGNMIWFLPLGLLLPAPPGRRGALRCLLAAAILSVGIEVVQYLLGTGVSDVDDVLLNAVGALAGRGCRAAYGRRIGMPTPGKAPRSPSATVGKPRSPR